MADTTTLKDKIRSTIYPNGKGAINALDHQSMLLEMADVLIEANNNIEVLQTEQESNSVAIEDLQDNKADRGGYEPDLSVGVADHLAGHEDPTASEFTFRKSGGGAILSGNARVQSVKGNSVVWNQLINNIFSDTTSQNAWYPRRGVNYASVQNGEIELRFDSQSDASGNSLRQQIDVRPGDKIYISYDYESHNVDEFGRRVFIAFTAGWSNKAALSDNCLAKGGEVVGHAEGFSIVPSYNDINSVCIYFCYTGITSPDTTPLKVANFRFVNLTRMFGAGNEPTTIEEYHSRIPQGIDMDAYNEGEVIHMNVDAVKSVGFNQWDEVWEQGQISQTDGSNVASDYHIRSKNFIKVMPGKTYMMVGTFRVIFYDAEKEFVDLWSVGTIREFTLPDNVFYVRLYTEGATYNHDICINISDAEKDGTYEPYISRMQSLEILRKYFPNGMRSAGTAHDEVRFNKTTQKWETVKRIGEVNMGNQLWQRNGDGRFEISILSANPSANVTKIGNVLCSKYVAVSALDTYNGINGISIDNVSKIWVRDSAYTDVVSFKAAMQGVILYYELANPIVTEIQETFNLDYEVWNGGTEQAIADTPTSAFKADIIYGFNAYGVIKELREQLATLQAAIAKMNV